MSTAAKLDAMSRRTLFTVLDETASRYGPLAAMHQPTGSKSGDKYRTYSWNEYRDAVREIACGLRSVGLHKGDIVALDSETRAEFYMADLGVIAAGCISAALYTSLPPEQRARHICQGDAKAVFVENAKTLHLLRKSAPQGLPWILLTGEVEGVLTIEDVRRRGREALVADPGFFGRIQSEISPDDHAVFYLTSGATGEPKMGLTTHAALIANIDMGPSVLPLGPEDSTVVFLPSAHIAQRVVVELLPMRSGAPVYFSEGLSKLPNELKMVRPTFLLAPPRVWERVFASVSTEIRKRPAAVRKLFYGALGLGLRASRLRHEGKAVPGWMKRALQPADRLVFKKIRARLGGRIRVAASGAAPLGQDLAHFYEAIGMPLIEGYGLTEGGVVSLNPLDNPRPGSIGKALPGVEVRLSEEGELLVKSPCLFTGYYKDPAATAAVLRDGWLHTGDLAEIDQDGYIYITGRKKEILVSSNGRKIYPARVEGLFKMEPLVNQVVLIGDRQPYVTALLTINPSAAEVLDDMEAYTGKPLAEIAAAEPVQAAVKAAVAKVNRQLASFEQIRRFKILERDFSIEMGELTPTMKVRRTQVLTNFRDVISELYLGREEMV